MKRNSRGLVFLLIVASTSIAGAARGQNVLQNAHFDHDVSGWTVESCSPPFCSSFTWNSLDAGGSSSSGSGFLSRVEGSGGAIQFISPVFEGVSYDFGAAARVSGSPGAPANVSVSWMMNSGPAAEDCGGILRTDVTPETITRDTWEMLAGTGVAPQGAKCAVLRLNVTFTQPMNPQQAYFDDAFFVRTGTTGAFYSVTQCRLVDTRGPSGPYGGPRFGPGDARTFGIAGNCGIPTQATAIAANLTVTNETGAGYFVVYPAGTTKPPTSTLNFAPSRTRANNAILQLGVGGQLVVLNAVPIGGSSDLILDVTGYFQ